MYVGAIPTILAYPNFKVEPDKYKSGLVGVTANLRARLVIIDPEFPDELRDCIALEDGTEVVTATVVEPPRDVEWSPEPVAPSELAFIQHSAGTTGLQKGVALSHAQVLTQLGHLASALDIRDGDGVYSWLPLYHDMGLISCFMLPLVFRLSLVMQSPTDWVIQPATMLDLMTAHRSTLAWVPNFTLQFLVRRVYPEDMPDYDLSAVRAIINCSEPVRADAMNAFLSALRPCGLKETALQASYAMAENVFAVTQTDLTRAPARMRVDRDSLRAAHVVAPADADRPSIELVSSGRCLEGNEVRVVRGSDPLPEGQVGELLVRSDSLFDGYYNRPDLTETSLIDGWYRTGDLGTIVEGEVYITGRSKELIIVAGKNIYPQDVEEIAFAHPAIHDGRAIAIGIWNADLGTEDIAVVAEVNDASDMERSWDIERQIKSAISSDLGVAARDVFVKPPRWIVKSTAGKPARAATREKLLREHPELRSEE
jgi:acyl-CoA synthetase (AMP-forming)/AMP-acid ligase II